MKKDTRNDETGLQRRLGLFATTLAGIGVILGAGIYVLVGVAAKQAGNAVWLSFLFAAIVAGFTGISYARLSRIRPKDAPEFQYLNLAFGRMPAFLAGWLIIWATVISAAAVALGFGGYLEHIFGISGLWGAIGLIVISALIVFIGVGQSALLAGILTGVEAIGLIIVFAIGIPSFGDVNLFETATGFMGVVGAASLVFFAYLGFEGMANLSEEMKDPIRDLPKAMLLSLGIGTIFYILVSIAAVSVLGWQGLSQSNAPLAAVASQALGNKADMVLAWIALASTANTVLLLLFASSRALWAMACAGVLPMGLCVIGKKRRTPWLAILIVGSITVAFSLMRSIESIAEFTNFAVLLAFAGVNIAAIKLFTRDNPGRRFKHFWLDIFLPAMGMLTSLGLAVTLGWQAALFGTALLIIGFIVYLIMKRYMPESNSQA
jgi:basic amino acid/polyamine antiporter, APA family